MTKKKLVNLLAGVVCAFALIVGLCLLLSGSGTAVAGGITVIVISLASGLILPNPLSLIGLLAGICMLVFPAKIVGTVFAVLGIGGAIANLAVWYKTKTE